MAEPEPQVLEPVAPIQGNLNLAHEVSEHESLYNAVWEGNYGTTEQIITTNSRAAKARITFSRRTALHVVAMAGHMSIVELLVQNLSPEDLEITDNDGFTALAVAIISNAPQSIAECMVLKNTRILTIKCYNMLPVAMAFHYGHKELGRYLYSVWGQYHKDYLSQNPQDGATIICNAIYMESFEVALDLLSKGTYLAIVVESCPDSYPRPPVHALANLPSAFLSGCRLRFWQRWLYNSICIGSTCSGNIHMEFNNLPTHVSRERSMTTGNDLSLKVWSKSIKKPALYDHNILAKLAPNPQLNRIPGAALQMQSELQWFQEVKSIVPPWALNQKNSVINMTPDELFTEDHKQLVIDAEKWMKETATSCTVVGALIITTMFAAAFTVPGGNNQDSGFQIFLNKKTFMIFIISDALSLFSSTTSVLMFLGILTSRYAEQDFLESLPRKLMFGLFSLFFSIVSMMVAFCATLLLSLRDRYSWIFIPVICLASIPATLFAFMQSRLLVDIFLSTYGGGIFDKKAKISK